MKKFIKYPSNYVKASDINISGWLNKDYEEPTYTSGHWEAIAEFDDGSRLEFTRPYTANGNYALEEEQQYNIERELLDKATATGKEVVFYTVNFVGDSDTGIDASTDIKADTDPEVQAALGREVDRLRRSDLFKGNVPKDIQDRTIENMDVYHLGLADAFDEACRELAPKGSELYNAWYNSDFRKFIPSAYLEKYLDFDKYPLKY